jgi:hypothetical protein
MPSENPYWKLVYEDVLKQLPAPDNQMRAAGLPGRVFPAVGNHEVWDDTDVEGLLNAFPYLKQFGVSDKRLIYNLDFNGVRFIILWTGKYDYRSPSSWDATQPVYDAKQLVPARSSSPSTPWRSAAPAWARSRSLRTPTRLLHPTRRTSRSRSSMGTSTRPNSTKWTG